MFVGGGIEEVRRVSCLSRGVLGVMVYQSLLCNIHENIK